MGRILLPAVQNAPNIERKYISSATISLEYMDVLAQLETASTAVEQRDESAVTLAGYVLLVWLSANLGATLLLLQYGDVLKNLFI